MYDLFIGCDISKNVIDVAYYLEKSTHIGQFPNDVDGFRQMESRLKELTGVDPSGWFVCFENTGLYSEALSEYLTSRQIVLQARKCIASQKVTWNEAGKKR